MLDIFLIGSIFVCPLLSSLFDGSVLDIMNSFLVLLCSSIPIYSFLYCDQDCHSFILSMIFLEVPSGSSGLKVMIALIGVFHNLHLFVYIYFSVIFKGICFCLYIAILVDPIYLGTLKYVIGVGVKRVVILLFLHL